MGRQLGLRSKEYKLKKQEMMKSEKEDKLDAPTSDTSENSSKTMMIGVGVGVGVLGIVFVYTKFKSSLYLPTLTPAVRLGTEQRESFEQERRAEVPRIITPSKIPKLTGVPVSPSRALTLSSRPKRPTQIVDME